MLDPKMIRDKSEEIRQMLKKRNSDFDLDSFLETNRKRLEMIPIADMLRNKKNQTGIAISGRKKEGGDASDLLAEMGRITDKSQKIEAQQTELEDRYLKLALSIPNMLDKSVPIGPDHTSNAEIRRWGQIPDLKMPRDHVEISADLDLVDLERAAKIAGARFYILKGDLVRLNYALIRCALDHVAKSGYTLIQPPYMINRSSMEGAVIAGDFEDVIYKVQDEDLYLVGTSEHAMAAMHSDEIIDGESLPARYAGVSPCFRKEAGAHGREQKGIFRVHQFEKIEQFVFARPEDSGAEHERMLHVAEEFYQKLEIPYRVMLLSSGDMGKVSAKTYDIEAWMAGQGAYREIVSCSNCLDYQARRLKTRFRDSTDAQTQYLHTLNSTLVATSRTLVSIMENMQTADGHVRIPRALQEYMGGQKVI
ncbi:MAG: serine--tRNA ligase [Nitrosopumilus sp. B06]|nr:MAG: serine--tRNA ligase [Nitrosopumilus sp. B06]